MEIKRLNYIDRLKGIAIIFVVMGHVTIFGMGSWDNTLFKFIQTCQMPLFMFISGYLCKSNTAERMCSKTFILKKMKYLLLPMFVFGSLYSIYLSDDRSLSTIPYLISDMLLAPAKAGYWYFMSLAVFYLSMPIYKLNKNSSIFTDILISAVLYFIMLIGWKKGGVIGDVLCLLNCTSFYPFFVFGMLLRKYKGIRRMISMNWLFTLALITYIIIFNVAFPIHFIDSICNRYIISFAFIIVICTIFVNRESSNSKAEWYLEKIGKKTLDIYVLHYFFVNNIHLSVLEVWTKDTGNLFLFVVTVLTLSLITICVSIGTGYILKSSSIIKKYAFGE